MCVTVYLPISPDFSLHSLIWDCLQEQQHQAEQALSSFIDFIVLALVDPSKSLHLLLSTQSLHALQADLTRRVRDLEDVLWSSHL